MVAGNKLTQPVAAFAMAIVVGAVVYATIGRAQRSRQAQVDRLATNHAAASAAASPAPAVPTRGSEA